MHIAKRSVEPYNVIKNIELEVRAMSKKEQRQINPNLEKKIDEANASMHKAWQTLGIIDVILGIILLFGHPKIGVILIGVGFLCVVLSQAFRPEVQRVFRGTGKKTKKKK